MIKLILMIADENYEKLFLAAEKAGKSVQALINEWITSLPEIDESYDVTNDPVFQMEGYDSEAPSDLSINVDKYIYGTKE